MRRKSKSRTTTLVIIGIATLSGLVLGISINHIGLGVSLGIAFGVAIAAAISSMQSPN